MDPFLTLTEPFPTGLLLNHSTPAGHLLKSDVSNIAECSIQPSNKMKPQLKTDSNGKSVIYEYEYVYLLWLNTWDNTYYTDADAAVKLWY